MDWKKRLGRRLVWRVDERATADDAMRGPAPPADPAEAAGRVVYVDESGERRRLPAEMSQLGPQERDAAIAALSQALGAGPQGYASMAAIERLTELRAAGTISEEQFERERRRLEDFG